MRKRFSKREESESSERWLLTYADMITLLMAFFIMMYSMSVLNLSKFRQAAISIRSGFGGIVRGQGKSVFGSSGMFASKPSPIEGDTAGVNWSLLRPLMNYISDSSSENLDINIGEDPRGIVITVRSDKMLFDPGSAEIRHRAEPVLDEISKVIEKVNNEVRVEGHTCDLPPRKSRFQDNWELSGVRAANVVRYLLYEHGLDASRFSVAGYGSGRPICPNDSEYHRKKNRRVEIVILRPDQSVEEKEDIDPDVMPKISRPSDDLIMESEEQ